MNYIIFNRLCTILILIIILSSGASSQSRFKPYFNAGYVTNLKKHHTSVKADQGGSIRIGVLDKGLFGSGRFGYYAGYIWFKEFNKPDVEYDERGTVIMAGLDFLLIKRPKSQWYIKLGLARERFEVTTRINGQVSIDHSYKPDLGILCNVKHFNFYFGSQPSQPGQINFGIGYTFGKPLQTEESGY